MKTPRVLLALVAVIVLSGCDTHQPSFPLPTGPTPPTTSTPPGSPPSGGAFQGSIAIRSSVPQSGTPVPVRSCVVGVAQQWTRLCTDQLRITFDVTVSRDVPSPVLSVGFYDGSRLCGFGAIVRDTIRAGAAVSLDLEVAFLTYDGYTGPLQSAQPCTLPVTTTRIETNLWTDADHTASLAQGFDRTFSFTAQ